ncbi:prophage PssSM-01 [Pseudomonas putida]|nr:prophage PssSM-01 [Pseudomonas putida]
MSLKLHKVLAINGEPIALVKEDVRLELRSPGRASFTVQASAPLKGLVTLDIGYNESTLQRHFIGYVERCTAANSLQQVLFCRELAAILAKPLPLNLRHVDLRAVLEEVSKHTGLKFRVPDKSYTRVKAPFFYSLATGYQAMDSLARVFSIDDLVWQQQGNGEVFVGSWADSFFGARAPLQLPTELFDGYQDNQSAMVAALPGMRPGATINQGERVTSVALAGTQMALKWKTQSNGR